MRMRYTWRTRNANKKTKGRVVCRPNLARVWAFSRGFCLSPKLQWLIRSVAFLNRFVQAYLTLNHKRNHVDHPAGPLLTILKSDGCDGDRDFPVEENNKNSCYESYQRFWNINEAPLLYAAVNKRSFACRLNCTTRYSGTTLPNQ